MPNFVLELLSCLKRRFGKRRNGEISFSSKSNEEIWKVVPLCLLWYLWRQ